MDSDPEVMAYKQWIHVIVKNESPSGDLKVQNAQVTWGKFYEWPDKDKEIPASKVNEEVAGPNGDAHVASCGRENSPSGTQGSFDIRDEDVEVGQVYWNCPWAGSNEFGVTRINDKKYMVSHTDAPIDGAIGEMTVRVFKINSKEN